MSNTENLQDFIAPEELPANLDPVSKTALVLASNIVRNGVARVFVYARYSKQTKTKERRSSKDYVSLPGIGPDVVIGELVDVLRKGNIAKNRRDGTVGKPYLIVKTLTRASQGVPYGFLAMRPEGIKHFVVTGTLPPNQEE